MLLATVVAIITCLAVANATQTITTPNAAFISFNILTDGGNSAEITPATNRPVLVMGCVTMRAGFPGAYGVGQVNLLHSPGSGGINHGFTWTGYNAWNSGVGTTLAGGTSTTGGIHIVYIASSSVDIQTASADTIRVHNIGNAAAGNVTLIW